jgi:hypothetical protein
MAGRRASVVPRLALLPPEYDDDLARWGALTRPPSDSSGVVLGDDRTNPREGRADEVSGPSGGAAAVVDTNAAAMFYACAFDLLAQTEAQHRAVSEAHTRLAACLTEWSLNPPTPARRRGRLSLIARMVREVVAAVRVQRTLAADMQRAISALQADGEERG